MNEPTNLLRIQISRPKPDHWGIVLVTLAILSGLVLTVVWTFNPVRVQRESLEVQLRFLERVGATLPDTRIK